jgi:DNA-binding protein H-NS
MARINLSSMSVQDLLQLRDNVSKALSQRAGDLHRQLAALGADVGSGGRRGGRGSAMKGKTVMPKYRGPGGETWAGRGARPRWLVALLKDGHKLDDFAIASAAPAAKAAKRRKKK